MALDMGVSRGVRLHGDATAASGIAHRGGAGRVRHIECATLWLQRRVTTNRIELRYRRGHDNVADIGTKHLDAKTLWKHLTALGYVELTGRSKMSLVAATEE
eukprot:4650869-Amphidinium_carterae.1